MRSKVMPKPSWNLGTLMRWTFFPNPNHVLDSEIPDIFLWSNGFWQIIQILVVFFAATHGFNGFCCGFFPSWLEYTSFLAPE